MDEIDRLHEDKPALAINLQDSRASDRISTNGDLPFLL